ncbi:MAG: hypothetical protein LBH13_09085 [Cellulomonadaceae bacterium]|nr:hypothetical protein [Cellulomonadaceae bacterium]
MTRKFPAHRIVAIAMIVLGLAAVGAAIASATVWRESPTVTATATPQGDGTMVVTDPGVLTMVSDSVDISASVPGDETVTLVIGRDIDVNGWVGEDPYTRVTGFKDWTTLATEPGTTADATAPDASPAPDATASPDASPDTSPDASPSPDATPADDAAAPADYKGPDPKNNDMWAEQASDTGKVQMTWKAQDGRWSLLAAGVGEGATAPTLTLTWERATTAPLLIPGLIAGGALILAGLAIAIAGARGAFTRLAESEERRKEALAAKAARLNEGPSDEDKGIPWWMPIPMAWPRKSGASARGGSARADAASAASASSTSDDDAAAAVEAVGIDATEEDPDANDPTPWASPFTPREDGVAGTDAAAPAASAAADTASPATAGTPATSATPAATATGPIPDLSGDVPLTAATPGVTRKMLREFEAKRAAEEKAATNSGRFKALTNAIPILRKQPKDQPAAEPSTPDPKNESAEAWRNSWGISGEGINGGDTPATSTEGEEQ